MSGLYSIRGDVNVQKQSDEAEFRGDWGVKKGVERQIEVEFMADVIL